MKGSLDRAAREAVEYSEQRSRAQYLSPEPSILERAQIN